MARKSERKRVAALKHDPLAYRREVSRGAIEVRALESVPHGERTALVGRLMLTDRTGEISKLGVFGTLGERDVILFERIEGNGVSVPAYLTRTPENVQAIDSVIHYGDTASVTGHSPSARDL